MENSGKSCTGAVRDAPTEEFGDASHCRDLVLRLVLAPRPDRNETFEILCVFGGFRALRLAVVSATCISSVLPATLTFKLAGINCGEIYAADRFALK
jgi:hypothetical protein